MALAGKTQPRRIEYSVGRMQPSGKQGARARRASRRSAPHDGRSASAYGHPDAGAWLSLWLWAALPLVALARLLWR